MARRPPRVPYALELENAIAELLGETLAERDADQHGNCWWTPSRLLRAGALMSWHEGQTLTERFEHVRTLLEALLSEAAVPTSYNGYAQALARQVGPLLKAVRPRLQQSVRDLSGSRWTVHGWVVFIADGSRFEAPRTISNETELRCAGKVRSAPQVFQTTLLHLGTNAVWDFRCGPGTASERRHLEDMLTDLPPRSLITADAGFSGFELYRRLDSAGVKFLLRVGGNVTLKTLWKLRHLDVRGDEVWVWPGKQRSQPPVRLRLLRLTSERGEPVFLVTNLLDPNDLSVSAAGAIYRQRWGIEVTYRTIKQTLNRATWLSRTARTVLAEHQATMLGFWLLQLQSLRELDQARQDLRRWSPAASRKATRRMLRNFTVVPATTDLSWRSQLGRAVKDDYHRRRSKSARNWPHKKHEPPPRPPNIQPLTKPQRQLGEKLLKTS